MTIFTLSYQILSYQITQELSYLPYRLLMSAALVQCAVEYRTYVAWMTHVVSKACSI
jgi:hypothetical protein